MLQRTSKLSKVAIGGAAVISGAIGGAVIGSYYNEGFREKVEKVPYAKESLSAILGPASAKNVEPIRPKDEIKSLLPVKKLEEPKKPPVEKPKQDLPKPPEILKPARDSTPIVPVDVHKKSIEISKDEPTTYVMMERVKERLLASIADAESKVKQAREAKMKTIHTINDHSKALKSAVDAGQNANWGSVSDALTRMEKSTSQDMAEEKDARNYIDNLRKIIDDAKKNEATASNPLLVMGLETALKLSSQLDELNSMAQKARNESRILNQYKDLIDKSRQQFAHELKSILPDIDVHAKQAKLNEDELNALIAHAHLKVDQLRRQLTEQQLREEQNIAKAIEDQRNADQRIAEDMLKMEVNRLKEQNYIDVEKKVHEQRQAWEDELEDRLRRAQLAHAEHLEQVLRTQRQLYDIEHAQAIEEAVTKERHFHSKNVELALAKLDGIENALQSRAAADEANRRCKLYNVAVRNLFESIQFGQKSGSDLDARRKPLAKDIETIKELCENDSFAQGVISKFPSVAVIKGLYTEEDLKNRFEKVYSLGRKTARIDDNGGGLGKYLLSYIQHHLTLNYISIASANDQVDVYEPNPYEVLDKARYFVHQGDFATALRLMQVLRGEPRNIARSWIEDTRTYLETYLLAEILLAHAEVVNIQTIY